MFQSPRNALIFVALIALGALMFVGGEDNPGSVIESSEDIAAQRRALQEEMDSSARLGEELEVEDEVVDDDELYDDDDIEYAEDEDLIDPATGFDPTPDADPSDDEGEFE